MKVLIINGSPRKNGNTSIAIQEMIHVFQQEIISIGTQSIHGCIACNSCKKTGKCVFQDDVNKANTIFQEADGLIIASPVYFASANASLVAFVQRMFYSADFDTTMKVGASVVVARRGGLSSTFDELNKFFTISNMPIASSQYWNSVHGRLPGEAEEDKEGLQTVRTLAKNMVFLMKAIQLAKEKYGLPEKEEHISTNFVH